LGLVALGRGRGLRLDLAEPRLEIGVLGAERLEVVAETVGVALPGAAEIAQDLADPAADAAVEIALELAVERAARLGVAEIAERAHHVDAQVRIGGVEQILERLTRLLVARELGERHDRGAPAAQA